MSREELNEETRRVTAEIHALMERNHQKAKVKVIDRMLGCESCGAELDALGSCLGSCDPFDKFDNDYEW